MNFKKSFIVIIFVIILIYLNPNFIWIGLIIILAIIVVAIVKIYNELVTYRNAAENAWSKIDVQLNRRADLIPNLVQTVKGYATHESSTFEKVAEARSGLLNADDVKEKSQANDGLTKSLKSLYAVAEDYPQLKANNNFISLQNQLTNIEDEIANARKVYNDSVFRFNNACQLFPNNMVVKLFNFKELDYFKVFEELKEVPNVNFNGD